MLVALAVAVAAQALTEGVLFEGRVTLACQATAEGGVADCRVLREHPQGKGYGDRALGMTANLKLPPDRAGKRKPGDRVVVPFQFKSEPADAPPAGVPTDEPLVLSDRRDPPEWIRRPTPAELARVFRTHVARDLKAGRATMKCVVQADGALSDCQVIGEQPTGYGMGAAALASQGFFRMGPPKSLGRIPPGATVVVPIIFLRE